MTKEELIERLRFLEEQEFFLQMKDRWTPDDYEASRKMNDEMREIREKLEGLK